MRTVVITMAVYCAAICLKLATCIEYRADRLCLFNQASDVVSARLHDAIVRRRDYCFVGMGMFVGR